MNNKELDDDQTTLLFIGLLFGPIALTAALAFASSKVPALVELLVRFKVLAPSSEKPLLALSWLQGAGLDVARIVILLVILILPAIWGFHRARRRQELKEQGKR